MMLFSALLSKLGLSSIKLSETEQEELQQARLMHQTNLQQPANQMRWVVADVETSGLNVTSDRLLAIGAVAVVNGVVDMADSFEVVVQQSTISSTDNILIHRISGETQRSGLAPVEALLRFMHFVGDSPLIGYHAKFDEIMIDRACKQWLGASLQRQWLDLAHLGPALIAAGQLSALAILQGQRARALDWWLEYFQITITQRHHAAADALATAQLFVALLKHSANTTKIAQTDKLQPTAKSLFNVAAQHEEKINQQRF
jgi:DNA polymerase III subunit epsilon